MPAYVISEVQVLDEAFADRYRALAQASIAHYGGRSLVRGGVPEVIEGDEGPSGRRVVIVEFPTMEQARKWYASAEYAKALALRGAALERRLVFVDGLPPG